MKGATLLMRLGVELQACWRPFDKLFLLALIAVAVEGAAEDTKFGSERAASGRQS